MAIKRRKVSVIGAGFTGATTALMVAQKELGDVVLVDIPQMEGPTKGKALDMLESTPVQGVDVNITGTSSYEYTKDSDVVVITAGIARKPGMSRDDLVSTNAGIMKAVTKEVVKHSPNAYIIVLTNPADAMTYTVYKESGFPKNRVIGQSGVLDTARFRTFVAQELNLSVEDITGFVLGGHGDDMVPLIRYSYAGGIPLEKLLPQERIDAIVERTRKGGGEIVGLLGNGSAYYAPAASLAEMVEAILKDKKRVLPTIAYLEGEYGYEDIYVGVPTILGGDGIEKVIELDLTDEEKATFAKSIESVRNVMSALPKE
ncbi:malate dehydrogenase [Halalkalibacterium halodurans]|uniref:Malate dehydrogenase n=1 Tax=Halalkalibacterium halodurans (strain ATCC BAA-125 / DSM 18197 / FERM 7344 / JCM 9153 / C-125) TaxID=272558 RepID=MDH_HALH5|nr:malate dehydrogenase [Halalkalibacterium halodurans]Q9K849.1 RecName: Full=Malate dehydrogenase [Halalkalibacterium halodurans C-125]MED4082140.1 malate dehydrogenase [Halalkalibacterium halodurans]MED4084282.1 malate dehydrogenase [Halalkalibacterium halodurans]MED4103591.1 malate dehydrogenase [Halalkalibacterium halodurans]MED4107558.1 malate dehydrogenase [Halalkalibacterium halodurans]MED4122902.1 malate dehydrogenase [Halalkalibacterium halodurans]